MSKLGIGIYERRPELVADANQIGCHTVLLFHYALDLAPQINTGIEIIGREFWGTENQDGMLLSTDLAGLKTLGYWQADTLCQMWPRIDCWVGLNEVMRSGNLDWLQRQVAFELGFADACQSHSKTMCAINAPPGVEPLQNEAFFAVYAETIRPLMAHPAVKYWGRHVYSKSRTAHLWDDAEYYALRHRSIVLGLRQAGVRVPPIVVTELGWADGWRATGMTDAQAADDLIWYADQVRADTDVHSVHVFGCGDSGGWHDHDVHDTGMIGRAAAWNVENPVNQPSSNTEVPAMDYGLELQRLKDIQKQLLDQNALLTQALRAIRQNKWSGADGVDGYIVALQGGAPLGFVPSFPKA
ncbi:MAG: hypothetical protein Q7O66_19740 [Dehalococcoidia bacterium]|nr:hypothetical protein [Dehalococcoidia bacterium]